MKAVKLIKQIAIYTISLLGAAGNALQGYMAMVALLNSFIGAAFSLSKAGIGLIQGLAIAAGGLCGGIVNFFINIDLLESFLERVTAKKAMPNLTGWQKVQYWFGSGVFILTGILFGLTAFAFGPVGALAAVAIAAGFFVAAIMMIQELETWLESFDDPNQNKKSISQVVAAWYASLSPGKMLGYGITVFNVIGLSLLFTLGLTTFLVGVGLATLPALIIGLAVAFTIGAFTEFYFYNRFLSAFCDKLLENLKEFWQSKYSPLGLSVALINATVFGVTSYVAIMSITSLLVAVSIALPPVGVVIASAATVSAFVGVASLVLSMDFWRRNSKRLPDVCCAAPQEEVGAGTRHMTTILANGKKVDYTGIPNDSSDSQPKNSSSESPSDSMHEPASPANVAVMPAYC